MDGKDTAMEGLEKIEAKLRQDAQAEVERLTAEADAKAAQIAAQAETQAKQESEAILSRGEKAAQERLERLSSAAGMEMRKLELAAKQEVLEQAFQLALDDLCALPAEQYQQLLVALLKKASTTGREQVILSPKDRQALGRQTVDTANAAMSAHLTLSEQTRPIRGGFILADGDVELNCAFETLVRLQREKLEKAAVQILFPE